MMLCMGVASAHEMTPTYPVFTPSHVNGVSKTRMEIFNKRKDVEYYEIGVFDKEGQPVQFVSTYKIVHLKYLGHLKFDVYVKAEDLNKVEYICSKSKLKTDKSTATLLSSRICSRVR
jgi:hypothetical protein